MLCRILIFSRGHCFPFARNYLDLWNRDSCPAVLPQEILTQKERTFTLPWEQWLRGPLRKRVEASFAEIAPGLAPHVHGDGVGEVWSAFLAGKTSWSRPWSIYALNEWCRRHL